jgi:hypothetical protein
MNVQLINTLNVISSSFEEAEQAVRAQVEQKHQAADEEFITRLLHGELRFALKNATEQGHVSRAFQNDLTAALGAVADYDILERLSADVFADSRFHKRSVETLTGGDFGLLIVRPSIQFTGHSLAITMAKQGLLCQAKLRHDETWGEFTSNQREKLKDRTEFLSLVLYSYADNELIHLNAIQWQPAKGATVRKMVNWLKKNAFPAKVSSCEVIRLLGTGKIGTDDKALIDELVAASTVPLIVITIDWPDDRRPDEEIQLAHTHQQQVQHVVLVRH